jgi:LEA14-like dessication related protein
MRTARSGSLLLFFFLAACAPVITRPEWRLQGVRIDQIDLSKITLGLNAQITNPNDFEITVKQLHYRLYLKEALIAEGDETQSFALPGRGVTDVWLPAEISLAAARQVLPLLKKNQRKEELDWRIEGECILKAFGVERAFPFKKEVREKKVEEAL